MDSKEKSIITVETIVQASVADVWKCWTSPEDIIRWNHASDDWHTTKAENDLMPGGKFLSRMEAKDGSMGFDFWGIYKTVINQKEIVSEMGDGRKLKVDFIALGKETKIVESFEAETTNSIELQRTGWQAILDNFKNYVEKTVNS